MKQINGGGGGNSFALAYKISLRGPPKVVLIVYFPHSLFQISYNELLSFMEETGINMQNRFLGYQRRNIKSFPGFMETLQATLLTNVKRVYVEVCLRVVLPAFL